jgi:hypothetical protein
MEKLFVTVLRGSCPASAKPIFATSDNRVVKAVAHAVGLCLVPVEDVSLASKKKDKVRDVVIGVPA